MSTRDTALCGEQKQLRHPLIKCPQCKQPLIFKTPTGIFISTRGVEATRDNGVITRTKCKKCRTWIEFDARRLRG